MINLFVFLSLIVATYTDIKSRTIPNEIPIVLVCLVSIYRLIIGYDILYCFLNLGFMLLLLLGISIIVGFLIKHDMPIGGGDIKLLSAVSFSLGAFPTLVVLLISQLSALVFAIGYGVFKRQSVKALPLAPFILIGFIVLFNTI